MSSTSITCTSFYCRQTNTPSIKLSITYPTTIPNLSYNFTLTTIVSKQTLFPKITYTQVHSQTIYVPKKEILINQLQPKTMYQVVVRFGFHNRKKMNNDDCEEKTMFVFTQGVPEGVEQREQEQQQQSISYSQMVRQNIKDYFHQYRPQQLQDNNPNYNQSSQPRTNSNKRQPSSFSQSIRSASIRKSSTTPLCNSQTMMKVIGESDPLINKRKLQKYILQGRKSSSVNDYLKTNDYLCFNSMNKVYKNQQQRRQHIQKALLVTKTMNMFGQIYQSDHFIDDIQDDLTHGGKRFFKNDWFMGPFYSYDQNEKQMKNKKNNNIHTNNDQLQQ